MKTSIRTVITAAAIVSASLISWSCMKNDGPYYDMSIYYPNAVVTVKPLDDKGSSFYMQLDDNTTLKPLNITASPYKEKEVRAFVNYRVIEDGDAGDYDQAVNIIWIDSLRTKTMAPDLGDRNETEYGSDPVEIIKGFPTVVEDGYMTLGFVTYTSGYGARHDVNLIYTGDPDAAEDSEKYVVEFRHNAHGDNYGNLAEGYVAFRLDEIEGEDGVIAGLPDTEGKTVKLTLKWNSIRNGARSVQFDYCTRKSSGEIEGAGEAEGSTDGIDTASLLKLD